MELFNIRNILIVIMVIVGFNYYKSKQEIDVQSLSLPMDTKVLAFGDSLTAGYGVAKAQSYPSILSELLHVEVFNEGVSGEFSEQGLARLPLLLDKYKPDILVLCHGANDILRKKDLAQAKANLIAMIRLAKSKGVYVLLVGVPTYDIISFNTASLYHEVAKEEGVEMESRVLAKIMESDTLKLDQVHPNAQGNELMAKEIAYLLSKHYFKTVKF